MRIMARCFALLFVTLPLAAQGEPGCAGLQSLAALYSVRDAMIVSGESSSAVKSTIEEHLHLLRSPLSDGTYEWVRLVRPSGTDGPVLRREKIVHAIRGNEEVDTFEARGDAPYAVAIVVPRKRSLLRGNNRVWIGEVRVRVQADGQTDSITHSINDWFRPDTSRTIDLGLIADVAAVEVEASTEADSAGAALVEVHFRQAVPQDDPLNPESVGVQALTRVQSEMDVELVDHEIATLERDVLGRSRTLQFGSLMNGVVEAETLLRSEKEEDRVRGMEMLAAVVEDLRN